MFFKLFGVSFLAFSTTLSVPRVNNVTYYDSFDNSINQRVKSPSLAYNDGLIHGLFNFNDVFDDSKFDGHGGNVSWTFDNDKAFLCPIFIKGDMMFITEIELNYGGSNGNYVDFYLYDYALNDVHYEVHIDSDSFLNDSSNGVYEYKDTYFNVGNSFNLNSAYNVRVFNYFFTNDDNEFVTSYDGYYNFINNSPIMTTTGFSIIGNIVLNNRINFYLSFYSTNNYSINYCAYLWYSALDNHNTLSNYIFPFRNNEVYSKNIYLNGVKMSRTAYTLLSQVGTFSYVRDISYDNTDFHDLLFSVADTPVYFVTQFLNFELFGMNLFIALSGLITLAIVIVVIRKIW